MLHSVFNDLPTGEKTRARDIIEAIRISNRTTAATPEEQEALRRFGGFGAVANHIFPDPLTGQFRPGWQEIGEELVSLLSPDEYSSARRTVFNAFYTSPVVMNATFAALERMGLPSDATILEPGCGIGRFLACRPSMRFIGVEMDAVSGRIARLLHPDHDIRIENFRDSRLPEVQAVVGNVPFADISLAYGPHKFSLHDYFFAKSVDALAPGGVLGLVTSRYTLDKQDSTARGYMAESADFIGAIRLPDDAFKEQGTRVVTDIVFLRKRMPGDGPNHAADWMTVKDFQYEDKTDHMNAYFTERPDMILGDVSLDHGQYGRSSLRIKSGTDYHDRLYAAIQTFPERIFTASPSGAKSRIAPKGLGEGSFTVQPDGIYQLECGVLEPVKHGERHLSATGTGSMGPRLAALIGLRDQARAVLTTQNEGMPSDERDTARRALNRAYDGFTRAYGPINKTTFTTNREGNEVRRMPNLVKFREDPDAVLVMSLEEYDEATGRAAKSPIMLHDVVGPTTKVETVRSAEEGLLVSLNELGRVDLDHIARLYGNGTAETLAELADLVFTNPAGGYETKDAYLSGNVRKKLQEAKDAGLSRNVAALDAVQPEDILPGDIDANLGAPWIPTFDLEEFATELFSVPARAIAIKHFPMDAVWSVEGNTEAKASVTNTDEYGTKRVDGLGLLDQALNLRTPTIIDEIKDGDTTRRVVNQEETVAAREKQKRIKQRFHAWVFSDPDRAERLVRIYNDNFNNIRLREFDGSHLTFPGMSNAMTPRKHQVNAIWRTMSAGNTLLAHVVGAGKTLVMATSAMKMKQSGLTRKSMICTPNHMLEQFSREFLHLYPNAKLLIAGKDDLARERRRLLTAKIATGNWDAIIVTHSSFERIGMSRAFQEQFIQTQIDTYADLLREAAANKENGKRGGLLKHFEKRKAAYEEKLKELSAEKKKDDGLVFDQLGVDQIYIDESHLHKNMEIATKMDRVAGIQTTGSQRAFDLFMKCRYLDSINPGRGVVFATGTPISNSMVEMYTMQRYLGMGMLEDRGIAHFDAWAASFGEVVDAMEISPDGASLRANSRFAKFVNLPELQQLFRYFADVQTADMLKLPVPKIKGGKPEVVSCPMSDEQSEIQQALVKRYERIKAGGVDPRVDNALKITTDGRKLALDARLIGPADVWLDSKLHAMTDRAIEIWERTADRRGTQMIFSDMGVNPTEWGFSVYSEIVAMLTERGVPRDQIALIGDAGTDAKKAALFSKVRAGLVRFLIGSTSKMGMGTNVQKRLVAKHDLDAPWKPAEIEQRDGRILRQGNEWDEIEIYRYVTKGSFDAFMWQLLQNKARFITQIMTGDLSVRRASDIGGQELTFAEVKAIASGNPAVLTLAEIEAEMQRLLLLKRSHADDQYRARQQVKYLPEEIEQHLRRAQALTEDHGAAGDKAVTVGTKTFADREKACEAMNVFLKNGTANPPREVRTSRVGAYRGFNLSLSVQKDFLPEIVVEGRLTHRLDFRAIAAGSVLNRIDSLIDNMPGHAAEALEKRRIKTGQLEAFRQRIGLPFDEEPRLIRMREIHAELEALLSGTCNRARVDVLVESFAALKGQPAAPSSVQPPLVLVEREEIPIPEPLPPKLGTPGLLKDAWLEKSRRTPTLISKKRTVARPVQICFQF